MRRWQREVALAVMLTVAAIAFIAAAFLRGDGASPELAVRDGAQAAAELSRQPGLNRRSAPQSASARQASAGVVSQRYCAVQPPSIE